MPENKISILSTRPLDPALTAAAASENIALDCISFIETEAVRDIALDRRLVELAEQPLVAIFTSMNAVDAVRESLTRSASRQMAPAWTIYCIGAATATRVSEFFGPKSIAGTAPSAATLAEVILNALKPQTGSAAPALTSPESAAPASAVPASAAPESASSASAALPVIFFCGDQRRDELPGQLRQQDIQLQEITVYYTHPTPHRLAKSYTGIAFFSPSAVHSFFSSNTPAPETVLFAIGETTEQAIRTHSSNPTIRSASPEKGSLIRLAIDHFKQ